LFRLSVWAGITVLTVAPGMASAAGSNPGLRYFFDPRASFRTDDAGPFACPAPVPAMTDMSRMFSFYAPTRTQSIVDPAVMARYAARVAPTDAFVTRLLDLNAQAIAATATRADVAACLVRQLREWADAHALLGGIADNDATGHRQAIMLAVWTGIGAANALAIARAAGPIAPHDDAAILAWFQQLSDAIVTEFTPQPGRPPGERWLNNVANHSQWAAVATGAFGALGGDAAAIGRSIGELDRALAAADSDGALPRELARGGKALHYQSFALLAIALLVRLADANHIALDRNQEAALQAIARFTLAASSSPSRVPKRVVARQVRGPEMNAWMPVIVQHFRRTAPRLAGSIEWAMRSPVTRAPMTGVKIIALPTGIVFAEPSTPGDELPPKRLR
jgi:hypothetical protein